MKQVDPASTQLPLVLKTEAASKQALLIAPKKRHLFHSFIFLRFLSDFLARP